MQKHGHYFESRDLKHKDSQRPKKEKPTLVRAGFPKLNILNVKREQKLD